MFKKTAILTSLNFLVVFNADAGTCTADSRTNVSANSVLTSTKYNGDLNTVYNRLNGNLDGGCITDGTIEGAGLENGAVDTAQLADDAVTFAKIGSGAMGAAVVSKTADYTLTTSDDVVLADPTSASFTLTLPTAVGVQGKRYKIKNLGTDESKPLIIDPNGSETVDGLTTYNMVGQDNVIEIVSDNSNWEIIGGEKFEIAIIRDEKSNGTNGGGCTSGAWRTRDLTNIYGDTGFISSLSSNQLTLTPGTYYIYSYAPGASVNQHQTRWANTTDSSYTYGESSYSDNGNGGYTYSSVRAIVEITANKTFELQHQCTTTVASNGFGVAASFSVGEVYSQVIIFKRR